MDIATLKNADLVSLSGAQLAYAQLVTSFGHHIDDWRSQVTSPLGEWTGSTAVQVHGDLTAFNSKLQAAHDELNLISSTLDDAEKSFALAQAKLIQALDDAQAAKITVNPDGSMTWDKDKSSPTYAGDQADVKAADIGGRVSAALSEAAQADQLISSRLKHFTDNATSGKGLDTATSGADQQTENNRENIPAKGSDPKQVKAWWDSLTPQEQHDLINNRPQDIGNLDGIPSADRDQANRINLKNLIQDRQTQLTGLGPQPPQFTGPYNAARGIQNPQYTAWQTKHDALTEQLSGFQTIQDRLDGKLPGGGGPGSYPPLLLLGIGDQGQGRAILSWGDPDTARNVSSLVPGLNSSLAGVGAGDAMTAKSIYDSAVQSARGNHDTPSVASVFWLGYDAPQLDGTSVLTEERADQAGPAYDKFLTGLRDTHQGTPAHMTAIGHSYGSLVVGKATQQPGGLPVDDIVLVGSPGVGVDKASQLGVGADHVYVGTAKNDPVELPPAVGQGVAGPDYTGSWFGTDPASQDFGAERFSVADGSTTDSHDNYFGKDHKGGDSLSNVGKIVSGHGNTITREAPW
ncbi:hypothetical protein E6W39_22005 [Kitasatospora acidiphila]|uniref:DUF1023 domain-containing protein n=1 Tax=Kitasatospora acidiphila TaxID=2567942 RepID=A0A540W660_9ACTN|nr:alpha/beta hydrolase [Kitasatospora acidiphila]TQF04407.1 hypothetical protein E6W39_22005 [Kitasatospora acidiphila]